MKPEQAVIDAIDALIDDQLEQGEPIGGYDSPCRCGMGWHGLPPFRCPGTPFEGPLRPHPVTIDDGDPYTRADLIAPYTLADLLQLRREMWVLPDDPINPSAWIGWDEYQRVSQRLAELNPGDPVAFHDGHGRTWHGRVTDRTSPDSQEWTITIDVETDPVQTVARTGESLREFVNALSVSETLPKAGTDGRPPVPRPSRTPPMWAHDPTRTRRRRNR